jgi:RNA polymerase sigma-70 factor, ECF subfamily
VTTDPGQDLEAAAAHADQVGVALLVVLDRLQPLERVAFVLHDVFGVAFDEVAGLIDRSPEASRQLASRARRKVRGLEPAGAGHSRHRELADAFVTAARSGDLSGLLRILDPSVTLTADAVALQRGPGGPLDGAEDVARFFAGRAAAAHVATLDGRVGLIVAPDANLVMAIAIEFTGDRISGLHCMADPARLEDLQLAC